MSILKRGIATMPLSTCRIISQYSRSSSWHHPSELLTSLSQPYEDPSSWTLNDSTPTSSPTYETTQFPPNTSIPSQTEHGPEPQTVYFGMQDTYMSLTRETFDYVFSSTCTIIPLQAITARRRHCTRSEDSITGPDSQLRQRILQDVHHLLACQACAPPTLWTSQTASNPREAMEFNLTGFHGEATYVLWSRFNLGCC